MATATAMVAAKALVVMVAFLLLAAAVSFPDGGGEPPFTHLPPANPAGEPPFPLLPPANPAAASLPNGGKNLPPFPVLPADPAAATAGCRSSVGECPAGEEVPPGLGKGSSKASTMSADGDPISARRVHHQQRDSVPCSRRGTSYYNCRPGEQANPYRRSCSRIKNCHG